MDPNSTPDDTEYYLRRAESAERDRDLLRSELEGVIKRAENAETRIRDLRSPAQPSDAIVIMWREGTDNGDAQHERLASEVAKVLRERGMSGTTGDNQGADHAIASAVINTLRTDIQPKPEPPHPDYVAWLNSDADPLDSTDVDHS
ncbi:hypothetical protein FHX42_005296 [Saccharopolyspora lacisalsi]|uniref:Uncharacterized protein n=1 Tax=Halosaccharopolyspora lacisalsi TaxID=1000566 RepID=A0A839E4W3_9PSEU|nr:hypothetical protein [Halosaccharopolyspora lacisalsi]MBA8827889.1 hypothetical protein [Halosaccharopolyspora lacisalsi]